MAAIKQQVIHMIESLPDEVTVDDIMAELYFRLQVDAGLKELDEGKGIEFRNDTRTDTYHRSRR